MPKYKNPTALFVDGRPFDFRGDAVTVLPVLPHFLDALIHKQALAPATAHHYARAVMRLARTGRLYDDALHTAAAEQTAGGLYIRWYEEFYEKIVSSLQRAFPTFEFGRRAAWLRVGSLVKPYDTKRVPVPRTPFDIPIGQDANGRLIYTEPATMIVSHAWTLHVPSYEAPAHTDPCEDCTPIELDQAQLTMIAQAFRTAWGETKNIDDVPPDAFLFGERPKSRTAVVQKLRVSSLLTKDEDALMHVSSTAAIRRNFEVNEFRERMHDADIVVVSRRACGDRLRDVLDKIGEACSHMDDGRAACQAQYLDWRAHHR